MEDDVEVDVEDDGGIGATTRKEYAQRQSREGDAGGGGGTFLCSSSIQARRRGGEIGLVGDSAPPTSFY